MRPSRASVGRRGRGRPTPHWGVRGSEASTSERSVGVRGEGPLPRMRLSAIALAKNERGIRAWCDERSGFLIPLYFAPPYPCSALAFTSRPSWQPVRSLFVLAIAESET